MVFGYRLATALGNMERTVTYILRNDGMSEINRYYEKTLAVLKPPFSSICEMVLLGLGEEITLV